VLGTLVKPLVGPSSILLALMASGLNGQSFAFNGYLPIDDGSRKKAILRLEEDAQKTGTTHIFIETPYRNDAMMKTLVDTCNPDTMVCVAANLTAAEGEFIRTLPVKKWKQDGLPPLHKKPAIFLLGTQA
jgi:16S rRNA (cytidine1402-2'-O)-methyltransferase